MQYSPGLFIGIAEQLLSSIDVPLEIESLSCVDVSFYSLGCEVRRICVTAEPNQEENRKIVTQE